MNKPKMLYASPFTPQQSGISDYSEILVFALQKEFDITLYTDNYELENVKLRENFKVLKHGVDAIDFDAYDYLVYNIGNNPYFHSYIYQACLEHPGLVILHDLVLYYLFAGYHQDRNDLFTEVYKNCGLDTFLELKAVLRKDPGNLLEKKHLPAKFAFNEELLRSENKFMVHSQYSFDRVAKYTDKVHKINMRPQIEEGFQPIDKKTLLAKYGIPEDATIVSAFGLIAQTKMNHATCKAVSQLHQMGKNVCYVMVGDGSYVDQYVDGKCIFKTGFVDLDEFNSFITHSDIITNLRYPSMGETSAAMLRILQQGKVSLINDGGWFSELPDDCVCRVDLDRLDDDLREKLLYLIENPDKAKEIEENAIRYIEEDYKPETIVAKIKECLESK